MIGMKAQNTELITKNYLLEYSMIFGFSRTRRMLARRGMVLLCAVLALGVIAVAAEPKKPAGPAEAKKPAPPEPKYTAELTTQAVNARIQKYRTAEVTLTITDATGKPLPNANVTVKQVRHKFLFGSNIFGLNLKDDSALQKGYQQRYVDLLNFATLSLYWNSYEYQEGKTNFDRTRDIARWCVEHGIRAKGHTLCWHEQIPGWLRAKDPNQVEDILMARITRDVKAHAGMIDMWDCVNEPVIMPRYDGNNPVSALCKNLTTVELIRKSLAAARAANPSAFLLVNDYDSSPKYEKLFEDLVQAGVKFDGIGVQSHQHGGYMGAEKLYTICERFGHFGVPVYFTEATIQSGEMKKNIKWNGHYDDWLSTPEGEQRQLQQVTEFYTVLFSHPAIAGITWWDFSDRHAWMGAPSGLIRADMSPKPAYEALMNLVKKEWWTPEQKLTTNAAGQVKFHGFLGDYAVKAGGAAGEFTLDKPGAIQATAKVKL